jgi:hypothetical protein
MFDLSHLAWVAVGGGIGLAGRSLISAITTDVARRISTTLWGIRTFDRVTRRILRHPIWSGTWEISWHVESKTFGPINSDFGEIARCFNAIAIEGSGTTSTGSKIPYGFVGKFSRDKSIITGIWFDRRAGDGGYHGAFQLRVHGSGEEASGLWLGFSESTATIKSDKIFWKKRRRSR